MTLGFGKKGRRPSTTHARASMTLRRTKSSLPGARQCARQGPINRRQKIRPQRRRCMQPNSGHRMKRHAKTQQPALPAQGHDDLVAVTRTSPGPGLQSSLASRGPWRLQDAKARFIDLVRLAQSDGPQYVTVHGRPAVVVVDADEFDRLKGSRTGQLLINALQASPHRQVEIEIRRSATPVRNHKL